MTPQNQEFEHGLGRQKGDCQRAVIASLLDLPISQVPHFAAIASDAINFWELVYDFVAYHGYDFLPGVKIEEYIIPGEDLYHQISGESPRNKRVKHAVVGLNGNVFFDPHPSRAGLAGKPEHWSHSVIRKII